jgi:hypothetical protein
MPMKETGAPQQHALFVQAQTQRLDMTGGAIYLLPDGTATT